MHASIMDQAPASSQAGQTAQRIFSALQNTVGGQDVIPSRIPVCDLLDNIVHELADAADARGAVLANACAHARSLQDLSPHLKWYRRPAAEQVGEPFFSGHANATIVGTGGLEERDDVWVGVSLLAPEVVYPEHRHPPEEVYVALTPGQWQQDGGTWHEPGLGGIVHNPPNILHAMRSGRKPLLATWCLLS